MTLPVSNPENLRFLVDFVLARDPDIDRATITFALIDFAALHDSSLCAMRNMVRFAEVHGLDVMTDIYHDLSDMRSSFFSPRSASYANMSEEEFVPVENAAG